MLFQPREWFDVSVELLLRARYNATGSLGIDYLNPARSVGDIRVVDDGPDFQSVAND